jgi:two-component system chemotaxis response regulator CheB
MTSLPRPATGGGAAAPGGQIRVMIVDDSAVIRGLFSKTLEADPEIEVVASVGNGKLAVDAIKRQPVDVVVLDIEMPVMDGITALPLLLEASPKTKVLVASTLTLRNAEISIRALSAGAADYVSKPTATRELLAGQSFEKELIDKIKQIARARTLVPIKTGAGVAAKPADSAAPAPTAEIKLHPASKVPPKIIAIGSSTGGPQALFNVMEKIGPTLKLPVVITQHMPPTFTTILAKHISKVSGRDCTEAVDGEPVVPGHVYVAPGDYHMTLEKSPRGVVIKLNQDEPENFCRPAVDVMLRSVARVYGANVLTVILTGMGHDGLAGGRQIVEGGGTLIAQDRTTSVVWGMPGAVAEAGICSAVLPISHIGDHIVKMTAGARP